MKPRISNVILKDLVLEYQKTVDPGVFARILRRTDRLICSAVHQIRKRWTHLKEENLDDLYQTGVLGIHKAALRIPETENPEMMPAWFVSYIKTEILSSYPWRPRRVHLSELEEVWIPAKEPDPMHDDMVRCLDGLFKFMLEEGVISEDDLELIQLNKVGKISINKIASLRGVCSDTISSKINGALLRIQCRVRLLDLEPEDCILC